MGLSQGLAHLGVVAGQLGLPAMPEPVSNSYRKLDNH